MFTFKATPIETLNKALDAIRGDNTHGLEPGMARYEGQDVTEIVPGMIPERLTWTMDRGNWMWDGVLLTLRLAGVDTARPLP